MPNNTSLLENPPKRADIKQVILKKYIKNSRGKSFTFKF